MAILMDGHAITQLVLNASNGTSVTKQLTESGSVSVDGWDIYSKELVETWGETINLKDDTNFDSLTPSMTAQLIGNNAGSSKSFEVDMTNYRYMLLREEYIKAAYAETPANTSFAKKVGLYVKFLTRSLNNQNITSSGIYLASMQYFYDDSGDVVARPNGNNYGIYEYDQADVGTFASSGAASTTWSIQPPNWNIRGAASYAKPETISAIDSENSIIEYRYRFFRMPYETLFGTGLDEANYIITNDGLRTLPSSGT